MKALVFDRFGEPSEVLQLQNVPLAEPGPGQVRVRMLASPINPSDLLMVRGQYGRLPTLPATPGFEGVGVIEAAGPGFVRLCAASNLAGVSRSSAAAAVGRSSSSSPLARRCRSPPICPTIRWRCFSSTRPRHSS